MSANYCKKSLVLALRLCSIRLLLNLFFEASKKLSKAVALALSYARAIKVKRSSEGIYENGEKVGLMIEWSDVNRLLDTLWLVQVEADRVSTTVMYAIARRLRSREKPLEAY
ncbi:hypothetical protein SADUNF_Sadunf08G0104400 [Salix dunnii]|uniref:Uncharacterized protein n=1 Tax=Salix dunnii TaxID=1413687 RepID=A0A835N1E4_9ROSI|nr:hypothetical protein SADUNF_Sadunf08G0104400 [Salix dunnii]